MTDFHNSFTDVLSWNCATKLLIKIPPHLRCVAGLDLTCSVFIRSTVAGCKCEINHTVALFKLFIVSVSSTSSWNVVCFSSSRHPLTRLLHHYQARAQSCVSVARDKLAANQPSTLQHSLPSAGVSSNSHPPVRLTGVDSVTGNITVHGERDNRDKDAGSLATSNSSISSSTSSSEAGVESSESHIRQDMAVEITVLVDRLERNTLAVYNELRSGSVADDCDNVLRLILEGFFFAHLWTDDILTFYRCAHNI